MVGGSLNVAGDVHELVEGLLNERGVNGVEAFNGFGIYNDQDVAAFGKGMSTDGVSVEDGADSPSPVTFDLVVIGLSGEVLRAEVAMGFAVHLCPFR